MSEIKIHNALKHQNVVSFDHFFEDEKNIYILLELCSNQTMNELLARRKRLTELEAKCYLSQIIAGLKHIHSQYFVHRDLKLRNLFLTDKMELKIGDFGLAAKIEYIGHKRKTLCGTPNYIAPEIISGNHYHSYEVDVWSLGIVLYTILIGYPPFNSSDVDSTYTLIQNNIYQFPNEVSISDEVKDLITKILNPDPSKRLTLQQILKHDFMSAHLIPKLLPISTLVCPPSEAFAKKYITNSAFSDRTKLNKINPVISRASTRMGKKTPSVNINSHLIYGALLQAEEASMTKNGFEVYVKNWIDYSHDCGIGFVMSNECSGALFNDGSRIVLHPNKQ